LQFPSSSGAEISMDLQLRVKRVEATHEKIWVTVTQQTRKSKML